MRGYFFALSAPLCWGITAICVKRGLEDGLAPQPATLLAILVALPLNYAVVRLWPGGGTQRTLDRRALSYALAAGTVMSFANLLYFVAIDVESVSVAVPLSNLSPVVTLVLAYAFVRRERITPRLVLGTLIILAGAAAIATR